jgi:hypothetical protein
MKITRAVMYAGRDDHVRIDNGDCELVVASGYGPRVLHYGLCGGQNVFASVPAETQRKPTPYGDDWHIYGGHRLWYAPEHAVRSYYPDNRPVHVTASVDALTLTQPAETHSGLQKTITVQLAARGSHVRVRHRLDNLGHGVLGLAPWALSAMAPGGRALFPHVPFVPHPEALSPARPLVLWPFTRMSDPRFFWGDRYVSLQQDPARPDAQKIGLYDPLGYMVYALHGQLFVKCHTPRPGPHADHGCNVQTFTNELFLELETLGPWVELRPGAFVEHEEQWFLFDHVQLGEDEVETSARLAPLLQQVTEALAG